MHPVVSPRVRRKNSEEMYALPSVSVVYQIHENKTGYVLFLFFASAQPYDNNDIFRFFLLLFSICMGSSRYLTCSREYLLFKMQKKLFLK